MRSRSALAALILLAAAGCAKHHPSEISGAMSQDGYLWQREWNPAVVEAFREASQRLERVVVLGGEIVWDADAPRLMKSSIQWDVLAAAGKPTALALRVAPYGGPFRADDRAGRAIKDAATTLLHEATARRVQLAEFQLDFDCAQGRLDGYRAWVKAVRAAIQPLPLVITSLPAWLDEPAFASLAQEAQAYVLQVHSVPLRGEARRATLCDPAAALRWVSKAGAIGLPFFVALPTYRCVAGYGPDGKLLAVAMDSVQPAWPTGTRVLEFSGDPTALAALVDEWTNRRPAAMQGLLWYRVPTALDRRNWRWPTLAAVMNGRNPAHHVALVASGENPVDVSAVNRGEAEETLDTPVQITWDNGAAAVSGALDGWTVESRIGRAVFSPDHEHAVRLLPGEKRDLGWLRFDQPTPVQTAFARSTATVR